MKHSMLRARLLFAFVLLFLGLLFQPACRQGNRGKWIEVSRDFIPYISAYTGGIVSSSSSIKIRLTQPAKGSVNIGELADNQLFSFEPALQGKVRWENASSLEFIPETPLQNNQIYRGTFELGKVAETPDKLKTFEFSFKTIPQGAALHLDFLQTEAENANKQYLTGHVETADVCDLEKLHSALKASQLQNPLTIEWGAKTESNKHPFTIRGVTRKEQAGKLMVSFDAEQIDAGETQTQSVHINPKGEFIINSERLEQGETSALHIHFSEPLKPDQVLNGLVRVHGTDKPDAAINGQVLSVFLNLSSYSATEVEIYPGIESVYGTKLTKPASFSINARSEKPELVFTSEGNILPQAKGMSIPFSARNLHKVDVKVIRILESNIPRFLSQNDLSGSSGIRQTGKVVAIKTIRLTKAGPAERGEMKNYKLNLDDLIKTEPGAIYRVQLSYKKSYVDLPCLGNEYEMESPEAKPNFRELNEASYYGYDDYYEDAYYDDSEDYNWQERDNPCSASFYAYGRSVSSNFIATSVGLMAKQGRNDSWHFYANDLLTGKPLPGVQMHILDYQLQKIASLRTNNNGTASIEGEMKETPFLVSAIYGQQKSYLKLLRSDMRPTENFDVSGSAIEEGLKLFMYTERGVWRPGDTIFLASVIHPEDASANMPPLMLKLHNSRGQLIHKEIRPWSDSKTIQVFKIPTTETDPTGNYRAHLQVGSATFQKYLRVETVLPNRIKMKLDFPSEIIRQSEANRGLQLSASWLHGTPAAGLKAMVSAVLRPEKTTFKAFPKYVFDDPIASGSSEEITLFDGSLDAAGSTRFFYKIPAERRFPGNVSADFTVRVFEQGGRFSVDRFSKTWMPFSVYCGVELPAITTRAGALQVEKPQKFKFITLNDAGKPEANRNLLVSVYKLSTRWWWQTGYNNVNDYFSSFSSIAVREEVIQTDSRGMAEFTTTFTSDETGAYLIRVCDSDGKHCAGAAFNVSYSNYTPEEVAESRSANELRITTDQENYLTGAPVTITFPSPAGGKAHVSIEDGLGIVEEHWVETQHGNTSITLKSNEKWAPNVYAHVSIIQSHSRENDLPLRLYGIHRIHVENIGSRLKPVIATPAVFRPETVSEIVVSEQHGRAMDYTLAIVDEGLLDLTRFETPDPWKAMNATEALGVNTWDIYNNVIGRFSGTLEAEIKLGGDGSAIGRDQTPKANRFTPLVRYLGPFHLRRGAQAKHAIKLPAYYGSVRVMLVASSAEGAWGHTDKRVEVKNPLMLLTTLPRVISPGEEIDLPVNIFALEKGINNVQIQVKTDQNFKLISGHSRELSFKTSGDQVVFFRLRAGNKPGIGKISVSARAGSKQATSESILEIRSPNPLITKVNDIYLKPGQNWEGLVQAEGIGGSTDAYIELSGMPAIDLSKRLSYLTSYPHGCAEQITSSVFPQLFLARLTDLSQKDIAKTETHVKSVIRRLAEYQTSTGGFSYWPGQSSNDEWVSSYAGHFLAEAVQQGYSVNAELIKRWKKYQKSMADSWRPDPKKISDNGLLQAYRLFTLALHGSADLGAMNRLREYPALGNESASLLAAAYLRSGQREAARNLLVFNEVKNLNPTHYSDSYGDFDRDEAIHLWVLSQLGNRAMAAPLARNVASKLGKNEWMSTQTLSWSMLALSEYYKERTAQRIDAGIEIQGKTLQVYSNKPLIRQKIELDSKGSSMLKVRNPNTTELFARIITSGIPGTDFEVEAASGLLKMNVNFSDLSGKPLDIKTISRGTDINITVMVTAAAGSKPGKDLALTMFMPSGWEIENNRVSGMEASTASTDYIWQDIRDDRVMTYFSMSGGSTKIFRFRVNAAYAGKFYLPAWTCEAMYDDRFKCNTASGNIEILAPQPKAIQ